MLLELLWTDKRVAISNRGDDFIILRQDGIPELFQDGTGSASVSEWLLLQAKSYTSEYEDWLDTDLEQDLDSFNRQMIAASGGDINSILCEILGHLPPAIAERLEGKLLNMSVVKGKAHFEMAA